MSAPLTAAELRVWTDFMAAVGDGLAQPSRAAAHRIGKLGLKAFRTPYPAAGDLADARVFLDLTTLAQRWPGLDALARAASAPELRGYADQVAPAIGRAAALLADDATPARRHRADIDD